MVTKRKVQISPLQQRRGKKSCFFSFKLLLWTSWKKTQQKEVSFQCHLKEVALVLSWQGAGIKPSSFILTLLVDHSEDGGTTMGWATRGTGRNGGCSVCCLCSAHTDRRRNSLIIVKYVADKTQEMPVTSTLISKWGPSFQPHVTMFVGNYCIWPLQCQGDTFLNFF